YRISGQSSVHVTAHVHRGRTGDRSAPDALAGCLPYEIVGQAPSPSFMAELFRISVVESGSFVARDGPSICVTRLNRYKSCMRLPSTHSSAMRSLTRAFCAAPASPGTGIGGRATPGRARITLRMLASVA